MRLGALAVSAALSGSVLNAQTVPSHPAFQAASIKPYAGRLPAGVVVPVLVIPPNGGIVRGSGISAQVLIASAYQLDGKALRPDQIIGAPDWAATTRFEFFANVASGMSREELVDNAPAMVRRWVCW